MTQDPVPPLPPKSDSSAKGCLIGCAIVLAVCALGASLMSFAFYKTLDAFTEAEARPVPEVTVTGAERATFEAKVKALKAVAQSESSAGEEFRFSGQDLNVMIKSNPDVSEFTDGIYAEIKDGVISGQVSFDLDKTPIVEVPLIGPALAGRFANGAATFSVTTENGLLEVYVTDFQVKGKPISQDILTEFQKTNLAEDANNDPEFRAFMEKVDTIAVEGNELVIRLK